jgi:hypothetical protein
MSESNFHLLPFSHAHRNGSQLVKEVREKKDKDKSRLRFWDMAGSKMGQITGLTNEEQEAAKQAAEQVRALSNHGCVLFFQGMVLVTRMVMMMRGGHGSCQEPVQVTS